jgi:hypothetical protein
MVIRSFAGVAEGMSSGKFLESQSGARAKIFVRDSLGTQNRTSQPRGPLAGLS